MAGVEGYTVELAHSVQATEMYRETGDLSFTGNSKSMTGTLVVRRIRVEYVSGYSTVQYFNPRAWAGCEN